MMKLTLILDTVLNPAEQDIHNLSSRRQLLFHSHEWDIEVIVARNDHVIGVSGRILSHGQTDMESLFNAIAVLSQDDELVQSATVSIQGLFEFRDIPDSDLRIEIFLPNRHLAASFHP